MALSPPATQLPGMCRRRLCLFPGVPYLRFGFSHATCPNRWAFSPEAYLLVVVVGLCTRLPNLRSVLALELTQTHCRCLSLTLHVSPPFVKRIYKHQSRLDQS